MHDQDVTSRDRRQGGRWTPLQRVKNDVLWALASLALRTTIGLPALTAARLGRAAGLLAHALASGSRRIALANVGRVLPELDPGARRALVRRCFATLGETLGETVSLLGTHGSHGRLVVTSEALAILAEARREGRGVVFVSAHLGPWEQVAASLVSAGVPLVTVARESYDPRLTRWYERLRKATGVGVVWRGSPGAAATILRTLRRGGVLGVPMDLRSRVPSCRVPFLGHPAPTPLGPARIALRSRAAVVVGTAAPGASSLVVSATRICTEDLIGGGRGGSEADQRARQLTARINDELARRILALPHAWVWMHERWGPHLALS